MNPLMKGNIEQCAILKNNQEKYIEIKGWIFL